VIGSGSTQKAALKSLETNMAKKRASIPLSQTPTNLVRTKDYLAKWLDDKVINSRLEYKTEVGYRAALKNWIIPKIGDLKLVDLTRAHIVAIMNDIAKLGRSRSTQVQIKAVLQPALQDAVDDGFLLVSPFKKIQLLPNRVSSPRFHDPRAVQAILDAARTYRNPQRWVLAIIYAMRQGEALGLQWQQVDLDSDAPRIYLDRQIQRQGSLGLVTKATKTHQTRYIPLLPTTVQEFKKLRDGFELSREIFGTDWNPKEFVFVTAKGTPIDASNDRKQWIKIVELAEVNYLPLRTARATAATNLMDVSAANNLLGHRDIRTTARYYEGVPDSRVFGRIEAAASQFEF
jgi:integrase